MKKPGRKLIILWGDGNSCGGSSLDQSFVFINENERPVEPADHEQTRLIKEIGKNPHVESVMFSGIHAKAKLTIRLNERNRASEYYLDVCLFAVRLIRQICQADVTVTTTLCAYLTRESRKS